MFLQYQLQMFLHNNKKIFQYYKCSCNIPLLLLLLLRLYNIVTLFKMFLQYVLKNVFELQYKDFTIFKMFLQYNNII